MVIYIEECLIISQLCIVSNSHKTATTKGLVLYPHKLLADGLTSTFCSLAVDMHDMVVPAEKTMNLQKLFKNSKLLSHNEGKLSRVQVVTRTSRSLC